MDYKADLHIHSYASDGQWRPEEIVAEVKKNGIRTFAVCDHDEVTCIPYIEALVKDTDLNYIKGVEISVSYNDREHHILTYFVDETNETLNQVIGHNRSVRDKYNEHLIEFLKKDYPNVSQEDFDAYEYMPYQGGWRFYGYLIDRGIIKTLGDYFAVVKAFVYKKEFKDPKEIIPLLTSLGYVPILAHPPAYAEGDLYPEDQLDIWREMGIKGLECYTQYMKDQDNAQYYVDYCHKHDLIITGGSDCHGGFAGRRLGHPHVTEDMITLKK